MLEEKKELNEKDKEFVKQNWNKMPLLEITRIISGNPEADGRHNLGKIIKEFIVNECGGAPVITKARRREDVVLTDENRKLIENHLNDMSVIEMAKLCFPSVKTMTNLHKEYAAVQAYVKEIDPEHKFDGGTVVSKDYSPPQGITRLIPKVNKAIIKFHQGNVKPIREENLTEFDRKCLNALLGYLNVPRFAMQINNFLFEEERDLFETNFIRYTFDKPDLIQEDVDQYLVLCDEIVIQQQIIQMGQMLDKQVKDHFEIEQDENGRRRSLPESLVEMIHKNQQKLNDSRKRADDLLKSLTDTRAKRINNKQAENASILNLVQAWQEEKSRQELIDLAEKQKLAEGEEVDKLSSMEAVIARIAGISKERAKH